MKQLVTTIACAVVSFLVRRGHRLKWKILFFEIDILNLTMKYLCAQKFNGNIEEVVEALKNRKKGPTIPSLKK